MSRLPHTPLFSLLPLITIALLSQLLFHSIPAWAAYGTNPPSGNLHDYAGGDWLGTVENDYYVNTIGATVNDNIDLRQGGIDTVINAGTITFGIYGPSSYGNTFINSGNVGWVIFGSFNDSASSSGGSNSITNSGTVGGLCGSFNHDSSSSGGSNSITNSGTVNLDIYGSYNYGLSSSGGSSSITNSGTVNQNLYGSYNTGISSSGGSNSITNSGTVNQNLYGSYNTGISSSGGSNSITNSGTVNQNLYGSYNLGISSSGGSNYITNSGTIEYLRGSLNVSQYSSGGSNYIINSGTVNQILYGSYNLGISSSGGSNSITNYGTVYRDICGSLNFGTSSSGGSNTITNHGRVNGHIYGSYNVGAGSYGGNDTISNYGYVGGNIYGADGNDTVIIAGGSTLVGIADGGSGTDILGLNNMGTITPADLEIGTKYINFEEISIIGGTSNMVSTWDLSAYTTSIDSGKLFVNGSLTTSSLTVHRYGVLGGNGTIHAPVIVYGTISPGNSIGALTVDSITFMPSSRYIVELNTNGTNDRILTSGQARINGGTLVTYMPRSLYQGNESWTILSAGSGVSGRFGAFDSNLDSQTLNLELSYSNKKVLLALQRTPFALLGATPNQNALASGIDQLLPQAEGNMAALIMAMDFDMDQAGIQQTLQALSPEIYSTTLLAGLHSAALFDQAAHTRMNQLRQQVRFQGKGDMQHAWSVWTRASTSRTDLDQTDTAHALSVDGSTLSFGADKRISNRFLAGFALGYSNNDPELKIVNHKASTDGKHLEIYGSAEIDNWYIDSSLGCLFLENSVRKDISSQALTGIVSAKFDSLGLLAAVEAGYDFRLENWLLSPLAGFGYTWLEQDDFSETGPDSLSITMDEAKGQSITSLLGLRLGGAFHAGSWQLMPHAMIAWHHDYADTPEIDARFSHYNNSDFTVIGPGPASDSAVIELGLAADYDRSLSLQLDYSGFSSIDSESHLISAGLVWRF